MVASWFYCIFPPPSSWPRIPNWPCSWPRTPRSITPTDPLPFLSYKYEIDYQQARNATHCHAHPIESLKLVLKPALAAILLSSAVAAYSKGLHGCKFKIGGSKSEGSKVGNQINIELIDSTTLSHCLLPWIFALEFQ